jgi:hypothetical protein
VTSHGIGRQFAVIELGLDFAWDQLFFGKFSRRRLPTVRRVIEVDSHVACLWAIIKDA